MKRMYLGYLFLATMGFLTAQSALPIMASQQDAGLSLGDETGVFGSSVMNDAEKNVGLLAAYDEEEDKPKGKMYFRESFLQGSLKAGTMIGATQLLIADTEFNVFGESEIFNTTFSFLRGSNTPFIVAQAEYMLFNSFGIGGFVGFSSSTGANKNSNAVNADTELLGTAFGVYAVYYHQVENWLYMSVKGFLSQETGELKIKDGTNFENYNFVRRRIALDPGVTVAPSERVQVTLGVMQATYSLSEYTGRSEISRVVDNEDGTQTTVVTRLDQKIDKDDIKLAFAPSVSILFTLFAGGGR